MKRDRRATGKGGGGETRAGPRPVGSGVFRTRPKIVRLPSGALLAFTDAPVGAERAVWARDSADHGETWSDLRRVASLAGTPEGIAAVGEALVDRDGELHLFFLHDWAPDPAGEGERGAAGTYGGRRIDIWHVRSTAGRRKWEAPLRIWAGYTGALNSVLQTRSGRILLPFSYYVPRTWGNRGTGLAAFTFLGMFISTVLYSDDGGMTWRRSNDVTVVTPDISYAYGACEPVAIELRDDRIWMLIRTQMGRFYESFSNDGAVWSRAQPTGIISSDSPAGLVRLDDGRIVLVWNHCLRHPYAYGGRQVIHAAVSGDEGKTWRGAREVGRDPRRNEPPPPGGDFGTAYPFPVATADNAVLLCTGQGEGRALIMKMDPAWLSATEHASDFAAGLEDWSVFGTRGVGAVPHPTRRTGRVLSIRRVDGEFPASAVWNFPRSPRGVLTMRVRREAGQGGVHIGLTDHFSTPFDGEDVYHNVVHLLAGSDRDGAGALVLPAGRWLDLEFRWDSGRHRCTVRVGRAAARCLPWRRETEGLSYLRLRAAADTPERGAFLVERVRSIRFGE